MADKKTLLCIHRDPSQLNFLRENGYELVTANNGAEGLRLLASQPVDAVVIEYGLGAFAGPVATDEVRQAQPATPIVMLTEHLEFPDGTLKSVDALVVKSDGDHFLLATLHFLLSVKPARSEDGKPRPQIPQQLRLPLSRRSAPFSPEEWASIRRGTVQF